MNAPEEQSNVKRTWYSALAGAKSIRWSFVVAFAYTVIVPTWLGFLGQANEMGVAAGTGGLLMAFSSLDKMAEFSAFGLSAKMREAVAKAEVSLRELQKLAKITGSTLLSIVQMTGRVGGFRDEQKEHIKNEVVGILTEIGVADDERNDVLAHWRACDEFDYAHYILDASELPRGSLETEQANWNEHAGKGIIGRPTPSQLRSLLAKHNLITAVNEERLKDYEYYCKEGNHRRPDEWGRRHEWRRTPERQPAS